MTVVVWFGLLFSSSFFFVSFLTTEEEPETPDIDTDFLPVPLDMTVNAAGGFIWFVLIDDWVTG